MLGQGQALVGEGVTVTLEEVQEVIATRTVDTQGRIANLMFTTGEIVGHIEARLPKNFLRMANPSLEWTLHWRSSRGMEQRVTASDLKALLARFGSVDLQWTSAESLDEVLQSA